MDAVALPILRLLVCICLAGAPPAAEALLSKANGHGEPAEPSELLYCPLGTDSVGCLPACREAPSAPATEDPDAVRVEQDCLQALWSAKPELAPGLPGYVRVHHKKRTAELPHWNGRTGNNIGAIIKTLFLAHMYACDWVHFPDPPAPTEHDKLTLIDMPKKVLVDLQARSLSNLRPLPSLETRIPDITRGQARALAEHYLRPLLDKATKTACGHVAADVSDNRTLVLHLRSGDVLDDLVTRAGCFAPCALANKIMAERGFERAVLITEPDLKHPCIDLIHNVTRVQASSVSADACAIMHAKNLALMARSTFADALSALNPHLEEYHVPVPSTCASVGEDRSAAAGKHATARLFYYSVQGSAGFSTVEQKMHYIADANESSVELAAECVEASEPCLY